MIDGFSIEPDKTEDLLGNDLLDQGLKFDERVNYLCEKAYHKPNVLARIAPYMNIDKKKNIIN